MTRGISPLYILLHFLVLWLFNYLSPDYFLAIASTKEYNKIMFALISCHKCFSFMHIHFVCFKSYLKTKVFSGWSFWTLLLCSLLCFAWMILHYFSWLVLVYISFTSTLKWLFFLFMRTFHQVREKYLTAQ